MLPLNKLYEQLSYAEMNGLIEKLNAIYDHLPATVCDQCGTCCTIPPPAFIIEYINMFRFMKSNLTGMIPEILEKSARFYFLELVDINIQCPFLDKNNRCLVYPVRSLSCRGYGLYKRQGYPGSRNEMAELAASYQENHGITLPEEIINYKLPECSKVRIVDGKASSTEILEVAISCIARLESNLFPVEIVEKEYTFVPLVTHLALSVLSEGAKVRKPRIMKEYMESGGSSIMMEHYVAKARNIDI